MSSGQISRDGTRLSSSFLGLEISHFFCAVSAMKKRLEKEALEQNEDD